MQSSFKRRTLPKFILVALAALAVGAFLSKGENATAVVNAPTYNATTIATLSSNAAGANADATYTLSIPVPSYNFSAVVNTTPAAAFVAPGPGHPSYIPGTHPAQGDVIGTLSSLSTLGLTNGLCGTPLTPLFVFLNGTVDNTDVIQAVPQANTPSGVGGTLGSMWSDDGAGRDAAGTLFAEGTAGVWNDPGGWADPAGTIPALTVAERTNGLPAQVDDYPAYLNKIFDPDNSPGDPFDGADPVQPLVRLAGADNVSATTVVLDLVVFAPNALSSAFAPPHPFADLAGLGYTSIAVLQDPTSPASPGSITDFCSALGTTGTSYGVAKVNPCNGAPGGGCTTPPQLSKPVAGINTLAARANPAAAGTYLYGTFHQSLRDSDADGKENATDTCATTDDNFDMRTGTGSDSDGDRIADACDLVSNSGVDDQDGDGWQNAGDNCPATSNADNLESEVDLQYGAPDLVARRGGPRSDAIGDACDPDDTKASGLFITTYSYGARCIGGTDADGDGWCAAATAGTPPIAADPSDADPARTPEDYDLWFPMAVAHSGSGVTPPMREPAQRCNDGVDNDGDTLVDIADAASGANTCRPKGVAATDSDGDGYSDEAEINIGTDALGRCEIGAVPSQSTDWPSDLVSGGIPASTDKITLGDLTSFLAPTRRLDTSPGNPAFNRRWDLVPGPGLFANWIVINDLTALISGSTGLPPMFGGATKAFGGPACTASPLYGD